MIIDKDEFRELGFECSEEEEELLEGCLKRAEYMLNALCGNALNSAMAANESSRALVKQAAAFQADALLKAARLSVSAAGTTTRVSLGDLSYTENSSNDSEVSAFDVTDTVKRLLRAAGCFLGTGCVEVIE